MQKCVIHQFKTGLIAIIVAGLAIFAKAGDTVVEINANGTTNQLPIIKKHVQHKDSVIQQYNEDFGGKIVNQWFTLLDQRSPGIRTNGTAPQGKVILEFNLTQNGTINNIRVKYATVDEKYVLICEEAISNCVPFEKWPKEMCKIYTNGYRLIPYTFYYGQP